MLLTGQDRTGQDRTGLTFSKLILFTLLFATFAAPGWARGGNGIPYQEASWDSTTKTVKFTEQTADNYTVVSNQTSWSDGWYVVPAGTVTINNPITVSGTVNLILCDGAKLNANAGIIVNSGNTLNIYAQAAGTGQLEAKGYQNAAGIGSYQSTGGTVVIHGGVVTANGGSGSAGIGGGNGRKGGTVTLYGGTVTANGGAEAAGIGGGKEAQGGEVTIYGGTVKATGGNGSRSGAGIGGSDSDACGKVTIHGGVVTATSGSGSTMGAGIGGGSGGVTINGGVVKAMGSFAGTESIHGPLTLGPGVRLYGDTTQNPETSSANLHHDGTNTGDTEYTGTRYVCMTAMGPVSYREGQWNEASAEVKYTNKSQYATPVTSDTAAWTNTGYTGGWYFVPANTNVTIDTRITVSGTVNLILCDGATLTAESGITVETDNTLNIYAQSEGTGKLYADTTNGTTNNCAGIGGGDGESGGKSGGTVTIHGGTVTAKGSSCSAGIGGSSNVYENAPGQGCKVEIYGGRVMATGVAAAGIGGGMGGAGGEVTIHGGVVTAIGDTNAAGIGGSGGGAGGTVKIYGGTVTATGGSKNGQNAPGIGGGDGANNNGTLKIGKGVTVYGGENENPTTLLDPDNEGKISDRKQYMTAESFVPVTVVSLEDIELTVGGTKTLTATVSPEDATSKDVVWSSDKPAVATVDKNGNVTGKSVGTATITVTATNGIEAPFYHVSASCDVKVNKGTPKVTAPTASEITYGQKLSDSVLSGGTAVNGKGEAVAGSFAWQSPDIIPAAGTHSFKAIFTPEDTTNYATIMENVSVKVNKAAPDYTVPGNLTAIYGQTLKDVALPNGWTWNDSSQSVGSVGSHSFAATFTPEDTTNYATVTENVTVTVNKATPKVTVPTGLTAIYGQTLKDVALPNGWTWNDSSQSVGSVGSHSFAATFTPRDTNNYTTVTENVSVTVSPKPDDSGNGTTDPVTPDPVKPDDELTKEQKAAVEEAERELEQDTADKAAKAGEAAKSIENSDLGGTGAGNALREKLTNGTTKEKAAAVDVLNSLTETLTPEELSDLSAEDIQAAVKNREQEREAKVFEAAGKVKDPTVPAATDLLTEYGSNTDLQDANAKLSVQPKLVQPEVLSDDAAKQAKGNIAKAATGEQKVAEGVDPGAVQAAAQPGAIKTSADITIEPASKDLGDQTKAVEKVFNAVSGDLAGANDGKGVVIATVLPRMTPKASGFFPLRVNLRHLMPGRRLRFWPSAAHFRRQASGRVAVAGVELASGQEGDFFFLDENGVPTATVSGDASKMTAVAFLTAGTPYEDAFITVDATEKDQETLTDLKEKANPNGGENNPDNPDSPTSNKGSGGCDAGLGVAALTAVISLLARRKK